MRKLIFPALLLGCILGNGCKNQELNEVLAPNEDHAAQSREAGKTLSHTKRYSAEVATAWFRLLSEIIKTTPYAPPPTARILAYSGMALYESVLPGMPSYQSMYTQMTGNIIPHDGRKSYYWPAAANAALARISTLIIRNYSAIPNPLIAQLEAKFNAEFELSVPGVQLQFSNDFGKMVADKIYDWSVTDGTLTVTGTLAPCPPYIPAGMPGNWAPTPPGFFPAAGACQGGLRTFIPGIVQATLPAPPPLYSTAPGSATYTMSDEVYQTSLSLTTDDLLISEAWRDKLGINYNTPVHILKLASQIVDKEKLNLEDASVMYAKQGIASFDAIASAFYAKFRYAVIRPITFIRGAMGFSTWNSLYPTPQHPAYPAVAPAAAAAAIVILENTFGSNYNFVDSTQHSLYGSWSYNSFDQMLMDVGRSRTHSGLNFFPAVAVGIKQGREVGNRIQQLPFKKP